MRGGLQKLVPAAQASETGTAESAALHPAVRSTLGWVRHHLERPCPLQEIADELGMNRSYLSFLFSRDVGLPFRSYVTMLRLSHAQDLLRNRRDRLAEIAEAVGYSSTDRFRAAFRRWSGLSPRAWRKVFSKT